jgi:hypothetical protein
MNVLLTTPFRSGSSLLCNMISVSPDVKCLNDRVKFFRFCYKKYEPLNEVNAGRVLGELLYRLENRFNIKLDGDKFIDILDKENFTYSNIYQTIMTEILGESKIYLDKETLAWTKIPDFLRMFPDGKAIMMIRDIRDVVVSFKKMTYAPGNDYLIAIFNVMSAIDHFLEYEKRYPDRFLGLRYEELKTNPETVMKRVCKFLDIEYTDSMLDADNWKDYLGVPWGNEKSASFYDEGMWQNPMGRWKKQITDEELFLCETFAYKQMDKFDMKPENIKLTNEERDNAVTMINSSKLLKDCIMNYIKTGKGVERYPVDPLDWERRL